MKLGNAQRAKGKIARIFVGVYPDISGAARRSQATRAGIRSGNTPLWLALFVGWRRRPLAAIAADHDQAKQHRRAGWVRVELHDEVAKACQQARNVDVLQKRKIFHDSIRSGRVTYRQTCFVRVRMFSASPCFDTHHHHVTTAIRCEPFSYVGWRLSKKLCHDSRSSRGRTAACGKFTGSQARERAGNGADRGVLSTENGCYVSQRWKHLNTYH